MNAPHGALRAPLRLRDWLSVIVIAICLPVIFVPYLMPVVILDRAVDVRRAGDEVTARLSAVKIRGCDPVKGTFVGWEKTPTGWREVGFSWVDDLSPDSSRPAEMFRQRLGPVLWFRVSSEALQVRVTVQHSCKGRVPFVTVLGPYDIPPLPSLPVDVMGRGLPTQ